MKQIRIMKLGDRATLPTRGHPNDAGLDLYAAETVDFRPGQVIVVPTHIAMEIPPGYVGLIRDRSSVGKRKLKVTGGVIDAGYTGSVDAVLLNLGGEHGCIRQGERFAQILLLPVATPEVVEVSELTPTSRGSAGFGSTGA